MKIARVMFEDFVVKNVTFLDIKLQLVDESIGKITQIKGGRYHAAALNERGEVYVSYVSDRSSNACLAKVDLASFGPVKYVECDGDDNSTLVVTLKDQLIRISFDPLGEPVLDMEHIALPKNANPILSVVCIGASTYVITPNQVYACGTCQAENRKEFQPMPQLANKKIIHIVGGDRFRIAQSKENNFFGWGLLPYKAIAYKPIMLPAQAKVIRCAANEILELTPHFQLNFFKSPGGNEDAIEQISLPTELQSSLKRVIIEDYRNSNNPKASRGAHLYRIFKNQQLTDIRLISSEEQSLTAPVC